MVHMCDSEPEDWTQKSFKSQKRWVSVPVYSGFFVETLNNCSVSALSKQQSVTHTPTQTHRHQSWTGMTFQIRAPLGDRMITELQSHLLCISCSLFRACFLLLLLCHAEPFLCLHFPQSLYPSFLQPEPSHFLSHKSLLAISSLFLLYNISFTIPLSPPSSFHYACYSSLSPTSSISSSVAPFFPSLLLSAASLQSETLLLCLVGLFWAEVLTLSGLGKQSDLWLTLLLTARHSLTLCVCSVCVCLCYVCACRSGRTMTQCTLSYLSYNASIMVDSFSTKLCTILCITHNPPGQF